jgi:HlyD family secretion protein
MSKLETFKTNFMKFGSIVIISLIVIGSIIVLVFAKMDQSGLRASGTIEAVQVKVAPQISGQVMEVKVDEGGQVQQGELLIKLDPSQLTAQLNQARSNLQQAQASYDLLVVGGSKEQRAAAIAAAERELIAAELALEELYENAAVISATAQSKVAKAREVLDDEEHDWIINQPGNRASPEELKSAKAKVTVAEKRLNKRQKQYDAASGRTAKAQAQIALTEAIDEYQRAVWYLDWLEKGADEIEMAILDADVALAAANLEIAEAEYERVKDGPDPDDVALAQATVNQAQAQLDLAQNGPGEEQLAVAQALIDAAQAAVDLLQVQLEMTEILAPMDGTILYRLIEPGELAVAGSPVITLVQLDQLSLTVFLPEDQYGEINLGDYVPIQVDSFPSQAFIGEVIRIADRAEYTPRNVQTQEGRRTTVFAIELRILDDSGKLKPGMPADVNFESKIKTK